MATLSALRRKVYQRLRDFGEKEFEPEEVNIILNEAQDKFSRDSEYLKAVNVQSISASDATYTVTPPSNYRVGRLIVVQVNDGSIDNWKLEPISPAKLTEMDSDWRNRTGSKPWWYVRNFDPSTADTARNDHLWLYPTPDTAYTNGLRVTYVLCTDGQMTADTTEMALPERVAEEALINYAASECLVRKSLGNEHFDQCVALSKYYKELYTQDLFAFATEAKSTYDRGLNTVRTFYV